ncbi:agmatine deiminase family protein [Tundrisphaera lichenicola]|uniref:agmatine deiminase family protein n=1 Tax=Tundrisphaera lichenicola TaxID=2029860 RepID=UPI003EBB48C3
MTETPAALGYRMPAEWEPHEATWIAWPHNRDDWPGKFAPIPWVYVEIVRHLSRVERVEILINGGKSERRAIDKLQAAGVDLGQVRFHRVETDRIWMRDSGPSFVVKDGEPEALGLVHWEFNAWAKYDDHLKDRRVPRSIGKILGRDRWKPSVETPADGGDPARVVLEGGSIDVNGKGTVLTTEECLLGEVQARNPRLDRPGIERVLADYLGTPHVVWLNQGIAGDDTHGHVDDLARFVAPSTVALAVESDPSDENYGPLRENLERLRNAVDQDGQPLRVIELPMPRPVIFEGRRLPASYANFYIANGLVLVPTFNDPADREALSLLASAFPDREVVGIHAVDLVWGLGTLHCLTQQQPRTPGG